MDHIFGRPSKIRTSRTVTHKLKPEEDAQSIINCLADLQEHAIITSWELVQDDAHGRIVIHKSATDER